MHHWILIIADTRLDDMRASVQGVANEELNAKLNAHKMNSTRGRKPKVGKLGMDTVRYNMSTSTHKLGQIESLHFA